MTPTARSLAHLRALGYRAEVVEKTIPHTFIKKDCFGVDLLALKPGEKVLVVQCTSASNHAARRTKLHESGLDTLWTSAGVQLEVWSWAKQGARGEKKTWTVRRETL